MLKFMSYWPSDKIRVKFLYPQGLKKLSKFSGLHELKVGRIGPGMPSSGFFSCVDVSFLYPVLHA